VCKGAIVVGGADEATAAELAALLRALDQGRSRKTGFPGTGRFDYRPLAPFFEQGLADLGDPEAASTVDHHTRAMEDEVVEFFADLFRAPVDDRWGYVTTGPTEGTLYGLYAARVMYPDGMVYFSETAHPSVAKAVELLGLPSITVRTSPSGELDYADLRRVMDSRRARPAIVVATAGTPATGAVDDVRQIQRVFADLAMVRHYVHTDAALGGIPAALLDEEPGFDLAAGADSISVGGQEFIGTPFPCGTVILRRSLRDRVARADGGELPEAVLSGTRNGHAALLLWYALRRLGISGLRQRAEHGQELAEHLVRGLAEQGWPTWRNPGAYTVLLKAPPVDVAHRWRLSIVDGWTRVACVPGVTRDQVDRFLDDLRETAAPRVPKQATRLRPRIPATAA
jgi:histidine decarboxylase